MMVTVGAEVVVVTVPTDKLFGGPATPGSLTSITEFRDGEETTTDLRFSLVTSTVLIQVVQTPLVQLSKCLMTGSPSPLRCLVQKGHMNMNLRQHYLY